MIEYFLWWVAEKKFGQWCLCVYSSILVPGAGTGGRIGTGETPFNAPERRKDAGNNRGVIGATWHLPRATA